MKNRTRSPIEVMEKRNLAERTHALTEKMGNVNSMVMFLILGAFSILIMVGVQAGQTPESVAQTATSTEPPETTDGTTDSTTSETTGGATEETGSNRDNNDPSSIPEISRGDNNDPGKSESSSGGGVRNTIEGVYEDDGSVTPDANQYWASPRLFANAVYSSQYKQATDACEFLVSCRYNGASLIHTAPVFGAGDYANAFKNTLNAFGTLLLMIPQAIFQYVEIFLVYTLSVDMMTQSSMVANEAFFKVGKAMFSIERNDDGSISFNLPKLVTILFAIPILTALLGYAFRSRIPIAGRSGWDLLKVPLVSFLFGGLGIIMVVQSGKNVSQQDGGYGGAPIVEKADGKSLVEFDPTFQSREISGNADNWAFMSPGWALASLSTLSEQIAAFAAQITSVMTNAVNNSAMREATQCDIYVNALHATFASTPAAQRMGAGNAMTIVSYDRMINSLFYKNYAAGALGDSRGAQNAWCRLAEVDTHRPAGQQAMISRVAGLNREAVGTGGLGIIMTNNRPNNGMVANPGTVKMPNEGGIEIPVSGGTMVDAEGNWVASGQDTAKVDSGAGTNVKEQQYTPNRIASQYFGPTYQLNENNSPAKEQAYIYWAVCEWGKSPDNSDTRATNGEYYPGGEATINPEWKNVKWAKGATSDNSDSISSNKTTTDNAPNGESQNADKAAKNSLYTFSKRDCSGTIIDPKPGRGFGEAFTQASVRDVQSAHFEYSVRTTAQAEEPQKGSSNEEGKDYLSGIRDKVKTGFMGAIDSVTGGAATNINSGVDGAKEIVKWLNTETTSPQDFYAAKFESAQDATGGNNAIEYLASVNGYNPTKTIVTAVFSLVVAYVIVKMVVGLLIGALIVQVMTVIVFVMGSFILLLAIVPLRSIRNNLKTVLKTIVTAVLTDGFMAFMFSAIFAINELLKTMILPVTQSYASAAVIGTFIAWLALKAFSMVVKQLSNGLDVTTARDSVKLAPMAIAPALSRAGFVTRSPIDVVKRARRNFVNGGSRRPGGRPDSANMPADVQQRRAIPKEEARKAIRNNFNEDRARREKLNRMADEERRKKQQEVRRKRKQRRMAADALEAGAVASGVGTGVAAAHRVGSSIWRPFQDGTIAAKDGAEKAMRKAGRLARDGKEWTAAQARMLLISEEGIPQEDVVDFMNNVGMGAATSMPEQVARTGHIYPNEDNSVAFDEKVPGNIVQADLANAQNVQNGLDMQDRIINEENTSASAQETAQRMAQAKSNAYDAEARSDRMVSVLGIDYLTREVRAKKQNFSRHVQEMRNALRNNSAKPQQEAFRFTSMKNGVPDFTQKPENVDSHSVPFVSAYRREAATGDNRGIAGRSFEKAIKEGKHFAQQRLSDYVRDTRNESRNE